MSFTISASAGEPRLWSGRNRASLLSWTLFSDVSRSTSGELSSGQQAIPGSYSASQTGQNIGSPSARINSSDLAASVPIVSSQLSVVVVSSHGPRRPRLVGMLAHWTDYGQLTTDN